MRAALAIAPGCVAYNRICDLLQCAGGVVSMNTQQLLQHGRGLAERFGMVKMLCCLMLGCLVPIACTGVMCCGLLLLLTEWR